MQNLNLAAQFVTQAKTICDTDPLVYNELGVIAYKQKRCAILSIGNVNFFSLFQIDINMQSSSLEQFLTYVVLV